MKLQDWNGRYVGAECSRCGITAVHDLADNLVGVDGGSLPAEITRRLRPATEPPRFDWIAMEKLSEKLGFYSDMQSLQCVDPLVWSVFGTAKASRGSDRSAWIEELLSRLGVSYKTPEPVEISIWKTLNRCGDGDSTTLENSASVITGNSAVFFEASWIPGHEEVASETGLSERLRKKLSFLGDLCGGGTQRNGDQTLLVLLSLQGDPSIRPGRYEGVELRRMSWQYLVSLGSHPSHDEINRYYDWKLRHLGTGDVTFPDP